MSLPVISDSDVVPSSWFNEVRQRVQVDQVNVKGFGAAGDGATDDTASILSAAAEAKASGSALYFPTGDYVVTDTILLECNVVSDSDARLLATDGTANPVLQIGPSTGRLSHRVMQLPALTQSSKVWSGTGPVIGSDVGILVKALDSCEVHIRHVKDFSFGVKLTGSSDMGCAYTKFFIGKLENNSTNVLIAPTASGWVNQNEFYGGRYAILSAEGSNIAGVKHLDIQHTGANLPNNNTFIAPSLEGDGPELAFDIDGGQNLLLNARFEASNGVRFGAISNENLVMWGFGSKDVAITDNGSRNSFIRHGSTWLLKNNQPLCYLNTLSLENPCFAAYPIGSDIHDVDAWQVAISAARFVAKATGDTDGRLRIESALGRLEWGDAAGTWDVRLRRINPAILRLELADLHLQQKVLVDTINEFNPNVGVTIDGVLLRDGGADFDSTVRAVRVPRMTTTQRDLLSAANGDIIYNTSLNKFQGYENGAWANLI